MANIFQQIEESKARQYRYPALMVLNFSETALLIVCLWGSTSWFHHTFSSSAIRQQPIHTVLTVALILLSILSVRVVCPFLRRPLRAWLPKDRKPLDPQFQIG